MKARMMLGAWLLGLLCAGCDEVEEAGDKVKEGGEEARAKIAAKIEGELLDFLECDGGLRPSTVERLKAVLRDPDTLSLDELVAAPEDVAGLVGMAGLTVEGYVLLARNLALLFEQGHVEALIAQGADGLSCDDTITLACTAGTGTTRVLCPPGEPRTIESTYSACVLQGRKLDGQMTIAVPEADETSAQVTFNGFTVDEVTQVVGAAALDLEATSDAQSLALDAMAGLQIISHGGVASGRSCGETLTLERLGLANTAQVARVGFKGSKRTPDATYALETFGADELSWAKPLACACPAAGSGVTVSVPRPLGRADEVATMRVTYGAAAAGSCATARVEMVGWPTDCSFLENPTADCGKGAAEEVIEPLLTAMCQPLGR